MNGSLKKRLTVTMAVILITALFTTGCSVTAVDNEEETAPIADLSEEKDDIDVEDEDEEEEIEMDSPDEEEKDMENIPLSKTVNSFNWDYYAVRDHSDNLFYSPLGISAALSMTLYGAGGNTRSELEKVLNISDIDGFFSELDSFINEEYGEDTELCIADSVWTDKTALDQAGVDPDFSEDLKEKIGADVKTVDFANDSAGAANEIKEWVNDKTEGFIPDYSSSADENTVMDIINAIYFCGKWETEFMKEDTFEQDFRGNKTSSVEMMHMNNEDYRYLEQNGFKGVELPYKDSTLAMDIMMPLDDDDTGAGSKWAELSTEEKEDFIEKLSDAEEEEIAILQLPKFDMDLTAPELKEDLQKLGIKDAFDPGNADFSGIAPHMFISDISHRAKIEVDEEGSRAAAITEIEMAVTAVAIQDDPVYFICDRPFVYVIKDRKTGVILFTGLVNSL